MANRIASAVRGTTWAVGPWASSTPAFDRRIRANRRSPLAFILASVRHIAWADPHTASVAGLASLASRHRMATSPALTDIRALPDLLAVQVDLRVPAVGLLTLPLTTYLFFG